MYVTSVLVAIYVHLISIDIDSTHLQVCTVLLEDLIGVEVIPKPPPNNSNACEFDINYYPKLSRRSGEKVIRKLISATLQFDGEPVFKDNLFQAVDWKKAVNLQTQLALRKTFHTADVNTLQCTLFLDL